MVVSNEQNSLVQTTKPLHVSHAALDLSTLSNTEDSVQLYVRFKSEDTLVATLNRLVPQAQLVLAFEAKKDVSFFVKGTGMIFLAGFFIPEESIVGENEPEYQDDDGSGTRDETVSRNINESVNQDHDQDDDHSLTF